jgi:hypothetical protein
MGRIQCSFCGKAVSGQVPPDVLLQARTKCLECIQKEYNNSNSNLGWSMIKPTEEGYYFFQLRNEKTWSIGKVWRRFGRELHITSSDLYESIYGAKFDAAYWKGPITSKGPI